MSQACLLVCIAAAHSFTICCSCFTITCSAPAAVLNLLAQGADTYSVMPCSCHQCNHMNKEAGFHQASHGQQGLALPTRQHRERPTSGQAHKNKVVSARPCRYKDSCMQACFRQSFADGQYNRGCRTQTEPCLEQIVQASNNVGWCACKPVSGGAALLVPGMLPLPIPSMLGVLMSAKGSSTRAESAVRPWPEGLSWRVSRAAGGYSQGLTLCMKGSGLRARMASQSTW